MCPRQSVSNSLPTEAVLELLLGTKAQCQPLDMGVGNREHQKGGETWEKVQRRYLLRDKFRTVLF